jgi:hypothetical protein
VKFSPARAVFVPDRAEPRRCPSCGAESSIYHVWSETRCTPLDYVNDVVFFNYDAMDYVGDSFDSHVWCHACEREWGMPHEWRSV